MRRVLAFLWRSRPFLDLHINFGVAGIATEIWHSRCDSCETVWVALRLWFFKWSFRVRLYRPWKYDAMLVYPAASGPEKKEDAAIAAHKRICKHYKPHVVWGCVFRGSATGNCLRVAGKHPPCSIINFKKTPVTGSEKEG